MDTRSATVLDNAEEVSYEGDKVVEPSNEFEGLDDKEKETYLRWKAALSRPGQR